MPSTGKGHDDINNATYRRHGYMYNGIGKGKNVRSGQHRLHEQDYCIGASDALGQECWNKPVGNGVVAHASRCVPCWTQVLRVL